MTRCAAPGPAGHQGDQLPIDLRAALAALLGYLQLLEDDGLLDEPELLRRYLAIVRGQASDLARLLSAVLAFAPPAAGAAPAAAGASLPDLVREAAGGRPVRLQMSQAAAGAPVDPDRLRLILRHLLHDARSSPGDEVAVAVEVVEPPPRLRLCLAWPAGLPTELARQALQAGAPPVAEAPAQQRDGAALWLWVARRAAERDGGVLELDEGPPATLRLELPLLDDPVGRQLWLARQQAGGDVAQTLRAIEDVRLLHRSAQRERRARELAEAQQLRAVLDFRAEHQRAVSLAQQLDQAYLETITALAKSVEARDQYTGGHVERVRAYSLGIGERLGLAGESLRHLECGAVLHDIGKIGVPDRILGKSGRLGPSEMSVMRRHPEIGRRVLESVAFLDPALPAVLCHHERWDGQGYPRGLAGEAIPLMGRIVAVADAYDAMTTDRPYRRRLSQAYALAEVERGRGQQFDPDIAAAFLASPPAEPETLAPTLRTV